MITTDNIKSVLFSNESDQNLLLKSVRSVEAFKALNEFDKAFETLLFDLDEIQLQIILAPFLRAAAIKQVRYHPSFEKFRQEYIRSHSNNESLLKQHLDDLARDKVFGTDVEARALAELLDVTLIVTAIEETSSITWVLHEATVTDRPKVHLFNQNTHWYIYKNKPGDTRGNGNCLYNSFAQILRNMVLEKGYTRVAKMPDVKRKAFLERQTNNKREIFSSFFDHIKIYKVQDQLQANFDKLPRRTEEQLANNVLNLSAAELEDHLIALQIAKNDDVHCKFAFNQLFKSIHEMKDYGMTLDAKKVSKGQVAIKLATDLEAMVEGFFHINNPTPKDFTEFKEKFLILLNSKNKEMNQYRTSWSTIIKNIAIALTGIGILFIAGKLLYSKLAKGRALFFFQNEKTSGEVRADAVKDAVAQMQ